jgi:DNA invertase Pin-like site-specific DNA recombinase
LLKSIEKGEGFVAVFGYARVSTTGQDYNGQIADLQAAGCQRIYREKVSGAKTDRVELGKLLKAIGRDDVVVVSRLDRRARSTLDLLSILRRVTEAGAKFKSLKDPWADTTTPHVAAASEATSRCPDSRRP